jgi:large subunit ribosomal protein L2
MPLQKTKPTSAGRRFAVKVRSPSLHKGKPVSSLLDSKSSTGGRNNLGRITTRHRGGGHKQRYRIVDFKRDKKGVPGKVERLEYDPNRSAHLALILYADGERRYIIAPKGLQAGDAVMSGSESPIKVGNCLPLRSIPVGTLVHCVELKPGKGAQLARSAGASAQLAAREAATPPCGCARARCARCPRRAARSSAKSATTSTTCASSARPAPSAGAGCARPCAAWR